MPRTVEYDREQVIEAAMRVFWRDGYEASSIQKLIEATGINRGSLYQAFGSKAGLFKEVLDCYVRLYEVPVKALQDIEDPVVAIRSVYYSMFLVDNRAYREQGCLLYSTVSELAHTEPSICDEAAERLALLENCLIERITEGQKKGLIHADKPASTYAGYIITLAGGLRLRGKMGADINTLCTLIDIGFSALWTKQVAWGGTESILNARDVNQHPAVFDSGDVPGLVRIDFQPMEKFGF